MADEADKPERRPEYKTRGLALILIPFVARIAVELSQSVDPARYLATAAGYAFGELIVVVAVAWAVSWITGRKGHQYWPVWAVPIGLLFVWTDLQPRTTPGRTEAAVDEIEAIANRTAAGLRGEDVGDTAGTAGEPAPPRSQPAGRGRVDPIEAYTNAVAAVLRDMQAVGEATFLESGLADEPMPEVFLTEAYYLEPERVDIHSFTQRFRDFWNESNRVSTDAEYLERELRAAMRREGLSERDIEDVIHNDDFWTEWRTSVRLLDQSHEVALSFADAADRLHRMVLEQHPVAIRSKSGEVRFVLSEARMQDLAAAEGAVIHWSDSLDGLLARQADRMTWGAQRLREGFDQMR